jgi:hypothetical protein
VLPYCIIKYSTPQPKKQGPGKKYFSVCQGQALEFWGPLTSSAEGWPEWIFEKTLSPFNPSRIVPPFVRAFVPHSARPYAENVIKLSKFYALNVTGFVPAFGPSSSYNMLPGV